MTVLESERSVIPHSQEAVFNYLADFRNFDHLIPHDKVSDWQATENSCSFRISGMADINMEFVSKDPHSELVISSTGKTPISFKMRIFIDKADETTSEGRIIMEADLNPMLKLMAERPLQNFLNMLASKMPELPIQSK